MTEQPAIQHALVAEPVHERDGFEQRRAQQRNHRHDLEKTLVLHAGACEGIRVGERQRDDDDGAGSCHEEAVGDGLRQRRGIEVECVVRQPDESAVGAEEAACEHHVERDRERDQEKGRQQNQQDPNGPVIAIERRLAAGHCADCDPPPSCRLFQPVQAYALARDRESHPMSWRQLPRTSEILANVGLDFQSTEPVAVEIHPHERSEHFDVANFRFDPAFRLGARGSEGNVFRPLPHSSGRPRPGAAPCCTRTDGLHSARGLRRRR